jgi:biuret amidohydrolase
LKAHGQVALVVIDVQKGEVAPEDSGIPHMDGGAERHARIRDLAGAARACGVPVVFVQEVHKRTVGDFGRELDGAEGVHCLEGDLATELADGLEPLPDEYLIRKRRYSAFFATELELVLRRTVRGRSSSSGRSPTSACTTRSPMPTSTTTTAVS